MKSHVKKKHLEQSGETFTCIIKLFARKAMTIRLEKKVLKRKVEE